MATRKSSLPTRNHILTVSARLLLKQGYRGTTIREIASEAGVAIGSVQNFFHSKECILTELAQLIFAGQFGAARAVSPAGKTPVYTYAAETALQLVITERNEQLREIYTEAYTLPETMEFIYENTAKELMQIFGDRFPGYLESDFYEIDIGTCGLMRGYMAKPCDIHFPLQRKIDRFLTSSLRIFRVEGEELEQVLEFVRGLDLVPAADQVIAQIFTTLENHFDCKL